MQPDELRQAAGESSTVERPGKAGPVAGQGKAGKAGKGRDRLRKKNGVLVVCDDGGESHRCARQLQAAGFGAAFNLKGGIAAWQRENQPLVAPKGRPA